MGLDRGGLALPADGIRFCFGWQGASTHDPQWVEPNHTASAILSLSNPDVSAWKYSNSHLENWASALSLCWRTDTVLLVGTVEQCEGKTFVFSSAKWVSVMAELTPAHTQLLTCFYSSVSASDLHQYKRVKCFCSSSIKVWACFLFPLHISKKSVCCTVPQLNL